MAEEKENCWNCSHRAEVPGSTHVSCTKRFNVKSEGMVPVPEGNERAIEKGWFHFPWNFDPIWIIGKCQGFNKK